MDSFNEYPCFTKVVLLISWFFGVEGLEYLKINPRHAFTQNSSLCISNRQELKKKKTHNHNAIITSNKTKLIIS